jgi:hypothetical protein
MMAGSLRSRCQFSKSANSSISLFNKIQETKMYHTCEMKIYPGDPRCWCQGHDCMPHPHTWGQGLGWPSPGSWLFPWRHQPHTDRTFTPSPSVLLLHQELPLVQFCSVVLTVGLVFTPVLQNHPGAKKKIIQSIEKRSDKNKGSLKNLLFMQGVDIERQKRVKQDMNVCQRKDY